MHEHPLQTHTNPTQIPKPTSRACVCSAHGLHVARGPSRTPRRSPGFDWLGNAPPRGGLALPAARVIHYQAARLGGALYAATPPRQRPCGAASWVVPVVHEVMVWPLWYESPGVGPGRAAAGGAMRRGAPVGVCENPSKTLASRDSGCVLRPAGGRSTAPSLPCTIFSQDTSKTKQPFRENNR